MVALALAAQFPALPGSFVWDDFQMIPENARIRSSGGLLDFWTSTAQPDYWPLAYSSHWLEWRVFGDFAPGFRAVNLLLHAVNAILLWRVLCRLRVPGAWVCGAVFAVHPVTVEAVAWILQRKTVLSTACALGALLCYLRFDAGGRRRDYIAATVLFLLGLLAKTAIVMWPFVLLICSWWQRRRLRMRDVWLSLPFFAISLVMGAIGLWFQQERAIGPDIVRDDDLWSRLALAGRAVVFYLEKDFLAVNLSFVYPRWELGVRSVWAFLPGVVMMALLVLFWWKRKTWGAPFLAAMGYFVVNLVPVLGLVNIYFMRYSLVADHWQYLALPGLVALGVGLAAHWFSRGRGWQVFLGPTLAGLVIVLLVVRSADQATIYGGADNERLWRDTLAKNPGAWMAYNNLSIILTEQGRLDEAIASAREALRLKPETANAEACLGIALAHTGNLAEAKEHLRRAMAIDPNYAEPRFYLGVALETEGRIDEAIGHYRDALKRNPMWSDAANNLAWLLATHPDPNVRNGTEAVQLAEQACATMRHRDVAKLDTLAAAYAEVGRFADAVRTGQAALNRAAGMTDSPEYAAMQDRVRGYEAGKPYRITRTDPQ